MRLLYCACAIVAAGLVAVAAVGGAEGRAGVRTVQVQIAPAAPAAEKAADTAGPDNAAAPLLVPGGAQGMAQIQVFHNGAVVMGGGGRSTSVATRSDGEHTLTLTTTDGDRRLVAKDAAGKTLFDGPVNTEEERKAVPPEIAPKFQAMVQQRGPRMGDLGQMVGRLPNVRGLVARGRAAPRSETLSDDEHDPTLMKENGEKQLRAETKKGEVVFEGPVQTQEQRKKVPAETLKKLEALEKRIKEESHAEVSMTEDGVTLTLTSDEGHQRLVAKDKDGKVLFEGPVDTWDQRKAMPDGLLKKLEKLWKSWARISNADPQEF